MFASDIHKLLLEQADPEKAAFFPRFFKAGPGEYAEGDKFLGVTVPKQRVIAKASFANTELPEVIKLLKSEWHDDRLTALFILVLKFQKSDARAKEHIYDLYLAHTKQVNNWDLVDSSAPYIVGAWLMDKDRSILYKLVKSDLLWERRIAMVTTLWFIRNDDFGDVIALAEQLLNDKHDLMHKAVGWCLREMGKKAPDLLEDFLEKHATHMPRTALRYSIERLPEMKRQYFLELKNN